MSLLTITIVAQINHSGAYGYSFKPKGNPPKEALNAGPSGTVVLQKIEDNKYRFWLDVTIGWPSYNLGETDGIISFVNDTASFDNTFEGATNSCILKFRISDNVISINSPSSSFDCGFGNGVHADGDYTRLKKQPLINNQWLKQQYHESPTVLVTENKAELFRDEGCLHPFIPQQYVVKGNSFLSVAETEKTIYTEFINPAGKFVYGWLKKSSVKIVSTE